MHMIHVATECICALDIDIVSRASEYMRQTVHIHKAQRGSVYCYNLDFVVRVQIGSNDTIRISL